ncbi:hypothetical protein BCD67_17070 [Oscillatoriales cyanobacterium USR001]|nr:hypothetical protein BCD67_17070 [Oscillatoriales cyanobacterium USR001]
MVMNSNLSRNSSNTTIVNGSSSTISTGVNDDLAVEEANDFLTNFSDNDCSFDGAGDDVLLSVESEYLIVILAWIQQSCSHDLALM